ncbi:pneumococcal serine-rich repeat protein isoform X4 [Drosophila subpulchrella]|uniref:pneumococcal serine-rich repeat protein isoform X4 n=1 Tax=Drosophila subpulchrella TaxID=1486046 RepID=UPI0018A1A1F8|nr:pneumococcal serine-rich repeat protein isoform X4 [Drosophila subpulchrella]
MEVATTSNHSQSHHHHHNHHLQPSGGSGGSRSPFQREVREWQRIDPNTGALFSGRLEAGRWINGPLNSYGKISDSQNISQPNGTQHTQRKQLEVLKARTANGAVQVIRTQTVQKSSSSWSSSASTTTTSTTHLRTSNSNGQDPPLMPTILSPTDQGVDICELSDDCSLSGSDAGIVRTASASAVTSSSATASASTSASALSRELIDDHVDFVVINGGASDQEDAADEHLQKGGHNLLPDTAPSLKLSNLMKSSSSISSQSSNNSNLTTAAQASNTHRSTGKISLHAIVGPESSSSSLSSSSLSAVWAKQADLYGQLPGGVGGSGGAGAGDADVAVAPPTQLRDLESFRHYNDDDDDLRLTARHQRRQQVSQSVYAPPVPSIGSSLLQRSRSISTDDLSNDWEREDAAEQPVGEWRRVSKLRRSFQSQDHYKSPGPSTRPRPLDLPGNSVSVARLRAELENGRRLHTAMRNNHVDLAALDNILNTPSAKPTVAKRNTFLTAESLQEIRGKLKKLSDESLYKEDFLAYHQKKPVAVREISVEQVDPSPPAQPTPSAFRPVHNTHSLESRQRQKDTSSSEWHLRRKSYGFEKMSPPEDKSIFRVDASTDSGLGRSGEQLGNWSPTERERERNERNATAAHQHGGTIVHFGRSLKPAIPSSSASPTDGELSKRHSIAVEETWRDVRKTSQVHVNGGTAVSSHSNTTSHLHKGSAQKRVEFCKTEVHFAAESGRVNIVETDGKPPPTQNFRRRRRSTTASGPLQSLVKSASAGCSGGGTTTQTSEVTHFGDPVDRRKTIATSTVAYRATLMDPPEVVSQPISSSSSSTTSSTQVTVTTVDKPVREPRYSLIESTSRNSYTSTSGVDTTDNETDELSSIRGILKNKPVKPKPYHLGENIESADVLWSVPAMKMDRESPSARDSGTISDSPVSPKSVAERIRIVEQRQQLKQPSPGGNGYSTKINVSLGSEDWTEPDLPKSNVMNISLHAPRIEKPKAAPPTLRIGQLIPVAKPRTLFIQPQVQTQNIVDNGDESGSESLKIVKEARGARKLREHELSYFGVQQKQQQQTKLSTTTTNPRRTLPSRSKMDHSDETKDSSNTHAHTHTNTTTTTKWQLLNDRPDLLRHSSPQQNDNGPTNDYDQDDGDLDEDEEHCYENIATELTTTFRVKSPSRSPDRSRSPGSYERKTDLQRDAQILSEMTRNADQTLKALSDEAAIKDQRRRSCSLQRRSAKPLETIDEKVKAYPQSMGVARGTFASEARRNSRQSTPSPSRARSSSQSSIECCPRDRSRSSSRESMTHGGGSSDDQVANKQRAERLRMRTPKREKSRHEPIEVRINRHSSKPRSGSGATAAGSSSLESKRSSHHSRHSREVDHSTETKTSSSSRLMRSSRVADDSRPRQSSHRDREKERDRERSRGTEKHREELTRSRGHSSRSRHSEHPSSGTRESSRPSKTRSSRSSHDSTTAHKKSSATGTSTTASSKSSKTTTHKPSASASTTATAPTTSHHELTYVYVTNLANTHTETSEESPGKPPESAWEPVNEADYASIDEVEVSKTPQPPPRSKRKRSLIPVPVNQPASYEYRTKLQMIPASYSNQSTLRCRSLARKKPSLKATQSTSSSFAFLPYLPAKRNSSVSYVYDNYLLYATSEELGKSEKLRPYQNNLSNEHAQLFGGGAPGAVAREGRGRLGGWPRRLKMRQVRSSVSTHQPFGICTCS